MSASATLDQGTVAGGSTTRPLLSLMAFTAILALLLLNRRSRA